MSQSLLSLLVRVNQIAFIFRESVASNPYRVGILRHQESNGRHDTDECRLEVKKAEIQDLRGKK